MSRPLLPPERVHPAIADKVGGRHKGLVAEVEAKIAAHPVVVIGMSQNPHPRRARQLLREKGIAHEYVEYGSYLGSWRERLAFKMWTGWPTFPMIFVKGTFVGGASDLEKLIESGELEKMLAA